MSEKHPPSDRLRQALEVYNAAKPEKPRPSGESGTGTPKEGGTESQAGDKLKLITDEAASLNRPS